MFSKRYALTNLQYMMSITLIILEKGENLKYAYSKKLYIRRLIFLTNTKKYYLPDREKRNGC